MLRLKQEMVLSGFLALLASILCYFSLNITGMAVGAVPPSAFPTVLSGIIALLSLINLLSCAGKAKEKSKDAAPGETDGDSSGISPRGFINIAAVVMTSTAYVVAIKIVGFSVATFVYLLLTSLAIFITGGGRLTARKAAVSLMFAVACSGVLYLVFIELLNVRF